MRGAPSAQAAQNVTLGSRQLAVPASGVRELSELGASLKRMTDRLLAEAQRNGNGTSNGGAASDDEVALAPVGIPGEEADEVEACRPYLDRQIELVKPKLIVALGRIAAQRLLSTDAPLSKLRGPLYHYGPTQTPLLITYHPAYLLRSPREKAKSWEDLKRVHQFLQAPA